MTNKTEQYELIVGQNCEICTNCNAVTENPEHGPDRKAYCPHCYGELFVECNNCEKPIDPDVAAQDDCGNCYCEDCEFTIKPHTPDRWGGRC